MNDHHGGTVETGAPMDYREHEKTYSMFLAGAKWGTMMVVVLLLAMVGGFFLPAAACSAASFFSSS
jgi:hypothetical protein